MFNRLKGPCDTTTKQLFKDNNPDGVNYDMCSGSLITNKHVLTSAECLLKNKETLLDSLKKKKVKAAYSEANCMFVFLGKSIDFKSNNGEMRIVKDHHIHPQAFTDISQYNYNLGKREHQNKKLWR